MPEYSGARFELSEGVDAVAVHREAWDELAAQRPSPFLTHAWISHWVNARAPTSVLCATLRGPSSRLLAGGVFCRTRKGIAAAADVHSGDWDIVAVNDHARRRLWEGLASESLGWISLRQVRADAPETMVAREALAEAGYGVVRSVRQVPSPYVPLPSSFDELLSSRSHNARQQVRRNRRRLESAGGRYRTCTGGAQLEQDLDSFLRVEASGWKGRDGTAILSQPDTDQLYRGFAREAAERNWLRLHLVEIDGNTIAGALAVAIGGEGFFLKIGFDESYAYLAPGVALTAEMLRAAIDEHLRGMNLLGPMDRYKARWTDELRPREQLHFCHGRTGRAIEVLWDRAARPSLLALRDHARKDARLYKFLTRVRRMTDWG